MLHREHVIMNNTIVFKKKYRFSLHFMCHYIDFELIGCFLVLLFSFNSTFSMNDLRKILHDFKKKYLKEKCRYF